MIGAAVFKLHGGDIQDADPRPFGHHVHKAEQILATIAEAHAPARAALEIAGAAAQVEGDHALIGMPEVDHAVEGGVAALQGKAAQEALPIFFEFVKRYLRVRVRSEAGLHGPGGRFVNDARRGPFLIPGIFGVAQDKEQRFALARGQGDLQLVGGDGAPAAGQAIAALAREHGLGRSPISHGAQEGVTIRIETSGGGIHAEKGIVIPPLAVFGFMIDGPVFHLDFAYV